MCYNKRQKILGLFLDDLRHEDVIRPYKQIRAPDAVAGLPLFVYMDESLVMANPYEKFIFCSFRKFRLS